MERFALIAENLPVEPLLAKLAEHPDLWGLITARQEYPGSAHKDTETIYLRWATDQSLAGGFLCLESEDHEGTIELLTPALHDIIAEVLQTIPFGFPSDAGTVDVGRVILTRMKPGGVITPHVDEGPYADKYDRFHVCLRGVSMLKCGDEWQDMRPGQLWWFNHKVEHRVQNNPTTERIHLILDLVAPEYRKKRGLTFQRERAVDLWDEIMPLLEKHYKEICHYKDFKLNPDMDAYNAIDASGIMRCFTARLNGDLIGYCMFFVKPNLHYRDSLQAVQDVLFIAPEHRGSRAGIKLIQFCEDRLKQEGVQLTVQHVKLATPKTIELLRKIGYEEIDVIMGKRLDREEARNAS